MFLAAVSGGADSTAMLIALDAIRREQAGANFVLKCIHVEHGLRAQESTGDADFVRSLCAELDLPCFVETVASGAIAKTAARFGIGIEAAARLYRRRAWFRRARRIEAGMVGGAATRPVRILVAHTRDDMLETTLMRVIRGAGPAGLAAMPASRGRILRPLLSLSRVDVINYLQEKKMRWREDSSNADTRFFRNRVRHFLVPRLDEWFPNWRQGIAALSQTQSLAAACIKGAAQLAWQAGGTRTDANVFFALPLIVREEALFQAIDRLAARRRKTVPVTVRRSALRRFCQGHCTAADLGPARVRISKNGGHIVLSTKKAPPAEYGFSLLIKQPGLYNLKGISVAVSGCSAGQNKTPGGCYVYLPLVLRQVFSSDRVVNRGRKIAPPKLKPAGGRVVAALDRLGTAAFIGSDGLFVGRDGVSHRFSGAELSALCVISNQVPEAYMCKKET